MITVAGLDLGTSGKSSICVIRGENYHIKCVYLKTFQSVSGPELEQGVEGVNSKFHPRLFLMETNGPGEVFAGYMEKNRPHIPLATIDTALPLPEGYKISLWEDVEINSKLVLNVRAAMYWILRLFFSDSRIKLYKDDEELAAQLSVLRWDHDMAHGDKIYMLSKKKLKYGGSELDDEPFSKSPDKADSLALGTLAYCITEQSGAEGDVEPQQDAGQREITEPSVEGMFPLIGFDEDESYA